MLSITIKRLSTLLLLLSLFGQAVAGSVMSCQMDDNNQASHSMCDDMDMQAEHMSNFDMDNVQGADECDQTCDCCLGACSSNGSLSSDLLSLKQPSIIKTPLPDLALLSRSGSLYRPPITR